MKIRPATRSNQSRLLAATASILLLSPGPSALADWTAHADFTSCPRKYFPKTTAEEGPFATEAACEAKVAEAKRGNNASCARYSCTENSGGSGGASSTEPGHQLDSAIERAIDAGVSGDISGTQAAGLVAAGVLGNALLAGIAKSPEQQRREQEQAEALRQQQAEQARQQAAAEEERKDRLLGEMQGVEQGTDLQLMTDGEAPSQAGAGAGAGGELALMTGDDDTRGFMGKRKAPQPARNQPPAARVNVGPYTTPVNGNARVENAPRQDVAMNVAAAPAAPRPPGPADRESNARGREDGNACRQRSPGTHCGVLAGEALGNCQRSYNLGYDAGAADSRRTLEAQGAAAAASDRRAGRRAAPFGHAEANGACGNIFVQAYNNAYR